MHPITKHYQDQMSKFTEGQAQHLKPKRKHIEEMMRTDEEAGLYEKLEEVRDGEFDEAMYKLFEDSQDKRNNIISDWLEKNGDPEINKQVEAEAEILNTPPHYNNEHGSLYFIGNMLGLNAWEQDIFKRLVRCRKKGEFKSDIDKTINLLKLYKKEYKK